MSEQTEEEYLIERLSKLLAEISVIVNGPQPMGVLWSYADLPEKVQALKDAALNAQGVPALEVFRIAGGDTECRPNPTADEALEVLRDLRQCYDEALNAQAGVVEAWDMPSEDEYPDAPEYEREVAWRQGWNAALGAVKGVERA